MEWISVKDRLPDEDIPILVFAPEYEKYHPMSIRIVSGQFVHMLSDVTHWKTIDPPGEEKT